MLDQGSLFGTPRKFDPYKVPTPCLISFSGGRTSGYLLWRIWKAYNEDLPKDIIVGFSNTGREDEKTLEFVRDVETNWGIRVHWIEYERKTNRPAVKMVKGQMANGQHGFRKINFESASRNGEPFAQLIDSLAAFRMEGKGQPPVLPNPVQRVCSAELKIRSMGRYMESLGVDYFYTTLGIRYDEPSRAAPLLTCGTKYGSTLLPLYDGRVSLDKVMDFWSSQSFDLGLKHHPTLGTYEGNCDFCFLKKSVKIKRLAVEKPKELQWWVEQEKRTGQNFRKGRWSFTDLAEGRVPLQVCEPDDNKEQEACFCTD